MSINARETLRRFSVNAARVSILPLAFGAMPSLAQDPAELLSNAKSIRCIFDNGTDASWESGSLKLSQSSYGEGGTVTFDSIDLTARTVRVIGNGGASSATAFATPAGLTFIEIPPLGNVILTTVFIETSESGRFIAVQSRHVSFIGPMPSQYHGDCEILE